MSRLTIEIDPEQHRRIKTLASFAGMSMKDYILSRTVEAESDEDATTALLKDPENAQRLRESIQSRPESRRVFENLDELRNALGI